MGWLGVLELVDWAGARPTEAGLALKCLPDQRRLAQAALETMRVSLGEWVLERLHEATQAQYAADQAMAYLAEELRVDGLPESLADRLAAEPEADWASVSRELVAARVGEVLERHGHEIRARIERHLHEIARR